MQASTVALVGSIMVPILAACMLLLMGPRQRPLHHLVAAVATAATTGWLVVLVHTQGTVEHAVGGWATPLGIGLRADGLSAFMVATTAVVGVLVSLYAARPTRTTMGHFWPLWFFAWAGLQGVFLSADLFNLYVALEVLGIAAVSLVGLARGAALVASIRYVLVTLIGSLFFLLGVALLYGEHATLDIVMLADQATWTLASAAALAFLTIGLALKAALFPLHFWLPSAHANASAPVSAILSALVCEAPLYLVVRVWSWALPGVATTIVAELVGAMAMFGIVWGSLQAMRQTSLKMLVAYSTVAQIGYLFLFVPLFTRDVAGVALEATAYYVAAHACAKAAMFLAVGTFVSSLGDDTVDGLRGVSVRLPLTTFSFTLAGITLVGLPPSGGFIAKWLLLEAAISTAHWPIAVIVVVGSVLTAFYVFLPVARALQDSHVETPVRIAVPVTQQIATLTLAVAGLLLGVLSHLPLRLLEIGRPVMATLRLGASS